MKREKALFDEIVFPGGKTRAFTMSYDDGIIYDRKLVEIMNQYGIRGTFNLNSAFLGQDLVMNGPRGSMDMSKVREEEVPVLYAGHEVAGHGLNHASPTDIGGPAYLYETIEDKANLEKVTGKVIRGYAYPFGFYNESVKTTLHQCGYHYARVVDTTGKFTLPADFLEWKGTAHHNDPKLMELAENFCKNERFSMGKKLFYVWGHSYEFAGMNNWEVIENLCAYMHDHGEDVWFATNIEIYDYVTAYRSLEYGAEGNLIYNPSGLEVSFKRDGKVYTVAPLSTLSL